MGGSGALQVAWTQQRGQVCLQLPVAVPKGLIVESLKPECHEAQLGSDVDKLANAGLNERGGALQVSSCVLLLLVFLATHAGVSPGCRCPF